jgi:hypothetical protein
MSAKIENCGDCGLTVFVDHQHGAFHGINRSCAGSIRQPALDRRLGLTRRRAIMIRMPATCRRSDRSVLAALSLAGHVVSHMI